MLSATIRLHQVKYYKQAGIPPVDRGMLMFYNMGKLNALTAENSIYNSNDAAGYIETVDDYPLKLDLALPAFSWAVHFRNSYSEEKRKFTSSFDCNEAKKYYLMAMEFSTNKEFKAKCVWMAAKCEHNNWLEQNYNGKKSGDFIGGTYFKIMKEKFSDTKYYKEVIGECGYFCAYLNPGEKKCIRNKD